MNNVRAILGKGLAKCYPDDSSATRRQVVENVVRSIRLVVGEGPFCGDSAGLAQSLERLSVLYLGASKAAPPIDTVLATFLALSFCDVSTAQDHQLLLSQFREQCAAIRSQVDAMLIDRGLASLVTPEDIQGVFDLYERIFHRYVEDPLWPAFKFPWTTNEQTRLGGALKLRLMQLAPLLDEMSAKVKYGGSGPELKKKTIFEISRAVQQLLPEAAFLRNPPYPGVSCQYRGKYGFTALIKGPFYQEGNRPKERFRAMKYFHLGHRLEEVVTREREFTISAMKASKERETHAMPQTTSTEKGAANNEARGSEHIGSSSQND